MPDIVLVATFGLGPDELSTVRHNDESYAELCDRLTENLGSQLRRSGFRRLLCPVEDERNGETLSIRVAFRLSDLSNSSRANSEDPWAPWELLEVGEARKIYGTGSAAELEARLDRAGLDDSGSAKQP